MNIPILPLMALGMMALSSCEKLGFCRDQGLQFGRMDYTSTQLRIDGYYYSPTDTDENGLILNDLIVFYRNGVVKYPGQASVGTEEDYLRLTSGLAEMKETKLSWGTFYMQNEEVSFCKWKGSPCGYQATQRTGEILNDTTFVVKDIEIKGKYGVGKLKREQYYHFRHMHPKPDSLNTIIVVE